VTNGPSVYDSMKLAFDDASTSDVRFLVEAKEIHAHKAVLKIRCEHFRSMFQVFFLPDFNFYASNADPLTYLGYLMVDLRWSPHYGMSMVLVAEGPGGVGALTAAKVFSLYFISCENHYTYGSKLNLYVLLISTVI
jgi:hypothetical protein